MKVSLAFLLLLASAAASADFQGALNQYAAGHYERAHAQFLALAKLGDGASQYNLAAMALRGQGGPKDIATAVGWLRAAADNGFRGIKPEQLAAAQSTLTDEQRRVAQNIVDHYGHAALLKTVLPAPDHPSLCADLVSARLVRPAPAEYPDRMDLFRSARRDGIVVLEVTVGVDGHARDPEVLMTVPQTESSAPAIAAVLKSRFAPATRNGVPLESRMQVKWPFSSRGRGWLWGGGAIGRVRDKAATGDPDAQYLAGLAATLDSTVGISGEQAQRLLLSAAQGGQLQAQYLMGRSFEAPPPCAADPKRQVWLKAAAISGDASAQLALATDLLQGTPSAGQISRARTLLELAAPSDRFYVRKHVVALMAASSIAGVRDPATALAVARKLEQDPVDSDPQATEVLAAAHAVNGHFSSAVSEQGDAIQQAKELSWNTSEMEQRLAAYRSARPWFGDLLSVPPASTPPAEADLSRNGSVLR